MEAARKVVVAPVRAQRAMNQCMVYEGAQAYIACVRGAEGTYMARVECQTGFMHNRQ